MLGSYLSERLPQDGLERENIAQNKKQPEEEECGRVHSTFPASHSLLTQQHKDLTKEQIHALSFFIHPFVENHSKLVSAKNCYIYPCDSVEDRVCIEYARILFW